jgi:mannosyltransferase OCH1-like enzyme
VAGIPAGCECADAREFLPESAVFAYQRGSGQGSYAAFADIFRYKLLLDRGGWWVDTDVVCLAREAPDVRESLAREDLNHVNSAIMRFPAGHPAMQAAYERAAAAGRDIAWGATGPQLVTEVVASLRLEGVLAPTRSYYPVHWSEFTALLLPQRREWVAERIAGATFLHLWSEMLRRGKFDKWTRPPQGSYLHDLYAEHGMLDDFRFEYLLLPSPQGTLRMQRRAVCP